MGKRIAPPRIGSPGIDGEPSGWPGQGHHRHPPLRKVVPVEDVVPGLPAGGGRSGRQHEIDFVVNRGNDKIYIQCALRMDTEDKRERELLPLRKSGDFFRKIIVTGGHDAPFADGDGILHVGVIPFLLDESILAAP